MKHTIGINLAWHDAAGMKLADVTTSLTFDTETELFHWVGLNTNVYLQPGAAIELPAGPLEFTYDDKTMKLAPNVLDLSDVHPEVFDPDADKGD